MYSEDSEATGIIDTFAARELQQSACNITPDDVMDYVRRSECNFDTLHRINKRKEESTLFIV